jgi:hypothetical protein
MKIQGKRTSIWGGYPKVIFSIHRARKQISVHRLVVEAFIGSIPKGMHVNHKNGVKNDNRLQNLEIVTPAENVRHYHLNRKPWPYPQSIFVARKTAYKKMKGDLQKNLSTLSDCQEMLSRTRPVVRKWLLKLKPVLIGERGNFYWRKEVLALAKELRKIKKGSGKGRKP